jgi:hypothetical protein
LGGSGSETAPTVVRAQAVERRLLKERSSLNGVIYAVRTDSDFACSGSSLKGGEYWRVFASDVQNIPSLWWFGVALGAELTYCGLFKALEV